MSGRPSTTQVPAQVLRIAAGLAGGGCGLIALGAWGWLGWPAAAVVGGGVLMAVGLEELRDEGGGWRRGHGAGK